MPVTGTPVAHGGNKRRGNDRLYARDRKEAPAIGVGLFNAFDLSCSIADILFELLSFTPQVL